MSLARRHRDRILASQIVASAPDDGAATTPAAGFEPAAGADQATPADRAAAQMSLRLTHDLRRLKEIKSVAHKIEAKRGMLPDYMPWVEGVLAADAGVGTGISADIVPTVMVWLIDIGSYMAALDILPFILRHDVKMPARYNRDPATIAVEEIASAALKVQAVGEGFPVDVLLHVEALTDGIDMHDEVRAKLDKAIGTELLRSAETGELTADALPGIQSALAVLTRAQKLHDRVGVKEKIRKAEKLVAAHAAAFPPASETHEQGGTGAA
ncbi:MAG: phage terminase small subunit [Sphingobium sp.]